jgi:hypothetical protein
MKKRATISKSEKKNSRTGGADKSAFFKPSSQSGLTINHPGDVHEQEADHASGRVMQSPIHFLSIRRIFFHHGLDMILAR